MKDRIETRTRYHIAIVTTTVHLSPSGRSME